MLSSLRLLNFRCFEQLKLELPESGALITGQNAQGKTSILESICLLVRLHSPRTRALRDMLRFGQAGFGIAAHGWERELQIRYQAHQGLSTQIDSEPVELQRDYLATGGLIVWMANSDLDLVRGSSASRRRFLDFLGTQVWPEYRQSLAHYRHALKCRNRILKQINPSISTLRSYDPILANHGEIIRAFRKELARFLEPLANEFHHAIGGVKESLKLSYHPSGESTVADTLEQGFERDRSRGSTLCGPHRDELKFYLNDKAAASFASEGQQRTLAISLKLAQGRYLEESQGRLPIYLIDDVFGELDTQRRQALMQHLPPRAQTLITTTNLDWLDETQLERPMHHYHLDEDSSPRLCPTPINPGQP